MSPFTFVARKTADIESYRKCLKGKIKETEITVRPYYSISVCGAYVCGHLKKNNQIFPDFGVKPELAGSYQLPITIMTKTHRV